ncbi:putative oxoglutarate/iron-dependent dioxygenase, glycosyltransferase, GlcNAc [Plasmopara halstedii]
MDTKTLLSTLSPQLLGLVEASLGSKVPSSTTFKQSTHSEPKAVRGAMDSEPYDQSVRLNPTDLFTLRHPDSPGFVIKENFLGYQNAVAVRDALMELTKNEKFCEAKVGTGENSRNDQALRGDKIHWIQTPSDLKTPTESVSPAILQLRRQVEALVYGFKIVSPELDLRNVVSTQFSVFPGDGARFVKHVDTYRNTQNDERKAMSKDSLVRLVTCVYYLNDHWLPEDGGYLRFHLKTSPLLSACHWDVPPKLDTLVLFRSLDVEHEVLPTYRERKAVTIWYYGKPLKASSGPTSSECLSIPRPLPSMNGKKFTYEKQPSIFVAIPSYRDSECKHTIENLFARATFPERIYAGICLQTDDTDETFAYLQSKYSNNKLRIHWMDYRSAAGPCVARSYAQKLWQGEEFYLQIDSHMRFRPGWDCFLINELEKCSLSKPILTTYPLGYTLPNEVSTECRPTLLCASSFDSHGMLRQSSKTLTRVLTKPLSSLFWAAGFAFSSAQVIAEVPYDESLRFLFFGEESSMAARLWTSGWNFFAPSESVVYHLWNRAYRPVFQELECDETKRSRALSLQHVKQLLQIDVTSESHEKSPCVGTYGLGSERSFKSYQKHIGIDFFARKIEWRAEWGNLDPIQFDLKSDTGKALVPK